MPSQFETLFAASAAPMLRDQFGSPGSAYTGPDGITSVARISVRVNRDDPRQSLDNGVAREVQTAECIVLAADLGAVKPVRGGRFTVPGLAGSEVWSIENNPVAENGEFVCACVRSGTERLMPRRSQ